MRRWHVWLALGCAACSAWKSAPKQTARNGDVSETAVGGAGSAQAKTDILTISNPIGGAIAFTPAMPSQASAGSSGGSGCAPGKFCASNAPDPDDCGTLTLVQDVVVEKVPGNVLLVFDQSLSMSEPWGNTGQTKLAAAQAAIANSITSLKDSLSVGALFFPTNACLDARGRPGLTAGIAQAVAPIDGTGQIPFQPAPAFLDAWTQHWANAQPNAGLGTPLQEAFDRADSAIAASKLRGALVVVAITDGAPTCFPAIGQPTETETSHAMTWLAKSQIKTYVIGLPGADGTQLLNDVAVAGGTMQYLLPDDPKVLEEKLRDLITNTITMRFNSCSINLIPAADPADKLQMVVVESKNGKSSQVPHQLSPSASWTINADGAHVEMLGDLCSDAMSGRFSSITFRYACRSSMPLPPLGPS